MKVTSKLITVLGFAVLAGAAALSVPGLAQSVAPRHTASASSTGEAYGPQMDAWRWSAAHGASWEQVFAAASR